MIKVLYLYPQLERSGPTNQLLNIINSLDRKKFLPVVLLLRKKNNKKIESILNYNRVPVYTLGISGIYDMTRNIISSKRIIDAHSPDIVHSSQFFPDLLAFRFRKYVKIITTVRGDLPVAYRSVYGSLYYLFGLFHLYLISKSSNFSAISCSKSLRDTLHKKYDITSEYINNGVNDKLYCPATKEKKVQLRKEIGVGENKKVFISTGSIDLNKDIPTIINGFLNSDVKKGGTLLVLGNGPNYKNIKELYRNNKEVRMVGNVDNVVDYLQLSDYFISASFSEGMPNAVLEAMSCGLVPILSNIGPHQEIMSKSDVSLFFNAGDYIGLSSCINKVIEKKYLDISKKTQDIVQSEFSAKIMSEKYQLLYSSLI